MVSCRRNLIFFGWGFEMQKRRFYWVVLRYHHLEAWFSHSRCRRPEIDILLQIWKCAQLYSAHKYPESIHILPNETIAVHDYYLPYTNIRKWFKHFWINISATHNLIPHNNIQMSQNDFHLKMSATQRTLTLCLLWCLRSLSQMMLKPSHNSGRPSRSWVHLCSSLRCRRNANEGARMRTTVLGARMRITVLGVWLGARMAETKGVWLGAQNN